MRQVFGQSSEAVPGWRLSVLKLLRSLFGSVDGTGPSAWIPRSDTFRRFEHILAPLLVLACFAQVTAVLVAYPDARLVIGPWLALVALFTGPMLFVRLYAWLGERTGYFDPWRFHVRELEHFAHRMHQPRTLLPRALVAVAGVLTLETSLPQFGYPSIDTYGLWVLYLIPLTIVSRFGTTLQWLVVMCGVALALAITTVFAVSRDAWSTFGFEVVALTVGRAASLMAFGSVIHVLVRQSRLAVRLGQLGQEMAGRLAARPSFQAAYLAAAHYIQQIHNPPVDFVLILMWNPQTRLLEAVGGVGAPQSDLARVAVSSGVGVTGRTFMTGKPQMVSDSHRNPEDRAIFFRPREPALAFLDDVRSELAVPIKYRGRVIGVLDIESTRPNAFSERDRDVLMGWASSLAVSFGHFKLLNEATQALRLAMTAIDFSQETTLFGHWFNRIAPEAIAALGATSVSVLRLAPGTNYPLLPFRVYPRKFEPQKYGAPPHIQPGSEFWKVLDAWELKEWTGDAEFAVFDSDADHWMLGWLRAVQAQSLVCVPVGARAGERLALLSFTFARRKKLDDVQKLALVTFADAVEHCHRVLLPKQLGASHMVSSVHHALDRSTHALDRSLDVFRSTIRNHPEARAQLESVEEGIRELRTTVKRATSRHKHNLLVLDLREALTETINTYREVRLHDLQIVLDLDEQAQNQEAYVRQVLYAVVVEAIDNALRHGRASNVRIRLWVEPDAVCAEVVDNGRGLSAELEPTSGVGIVGLQRMLFVELKAELIIENAEACGARVGLRVPLPPQPSTARSVW